MSTGWLAVNSQTEVLNAAIPLTKTTPEKSSCGRQSVTDSRAGISFARGEVIVKRDSCPLWRFIVLALLLVYANYFETEEKLPPGVQKPVSILGCSDKDIVSLTWRNGAEAELKVKYGKEGSRIVSPADYPVDHGEAEGLLKHFSELRSELISVENATDTAPYGIDASSPVVLVETATQTVQLTLGAKTEVGGSYYLVRQGDPRVFMVPGYIKGSFARGLRLHK